MTSSKFYKMQAGLKQGRDIFQEVTRESQEYIKEAYDLFSDFILMLGQAVSKESDEEKYIEIAIVISRRIVSSYVLLESGLFQEAQMVLRNAMELFLILIDIAHSKDSIEEWKESKQQDTGNYEVNWYFRTSNVVKRIKNSKDTPAIEKWLAEDSFGKWKEISNATLHAYSYAQIAPLIKDGSVQVLGGKNKEGYERDFIASGSFMLNVISVLAGAPVFARFLENLDKNKEHDKLNEVRRRHKEIHRRYHDYRVKVEKTFDVWASSKKELERYIKANLTGFPINISSIPDDAKINKVRFDFTNPEEPFITVDYQIQPGSDPSFC